MDLKPFLIYIGSFLAFSIILIVIVKIYAVGFASGKKPIIYGFISSVIVAVSASLLAYTTKNMFLVFWYMASLFLVFGIIHVVFTRKKYFYSYKRKPDKVLTAEVLFGLSIMLFIVALFSSFEYFFKGNKTFPFYPMILSTLAFFVPLFVSHTFEAALSIPAAEYNTWQYPLQERIEYPEDNNERLLVISYKIAKKATDQNKKYFRGKAPESMTLGEAYYHFLNDYNDSQNEIAIQYTDNDFEVHEWWFHKEVKWYQRQRILDPDLTVRENGIKENTVIICERIQHFIQEYNYHERSA